MNQNDFESLKRGMAQVDAIRTGEMMTHRSYSARVEYDEDDRIYFGRVADIRDGVGFHADTVEELRVAFREAVDDYIEMRARLGA